MSSTATAVCIPQAIKEVKAPTTAIAARISRMAAEHHPEIYTYFFAGRIYQYMKNIDHVFENKHDFALYLATNIFSPFKNSSTRRLMTSIQFIVLNFDPFN